MIPKELILEVARIQKRGLESGKGLIPRERIGQFSLNTNHALIISGIRRCGKSTLLKQLIKITPKCGYFNFEDQRIMGFGVEDFEKLSLALEEIYGPCESFFFDEIQNVPEWERFVRKMQDIQKKFVITGSNASLLSRELGTKLTGRHLQYELFPFSYIEFLDFIHQIPCAESFMDYLGRGGFPEFLENNQADVLQELLNDILTRDIIVRHKLRESEILRELAVLLLTNVGKPFSYNKLAKQFNLGSVNSVISYIKYFEDSYLLFSVSQIEYSYRKQLISPKKIYSIDTGFSSANSASFSKDTGRMLENMVFLHLRRKYKDLFFYKGEGECDFVIKEKGEVTKAVQVCWEINSDNSKRELSGLLEAMKKLKAKEGIIVTFNQEDNMAGIPIIPAWKWVSGQIR